MGPQCSTRLPAATAKNIVPRYGPKHRTWFLAIRDSAEHKSGCGPQHVTCFPAWATVRNQVTCCHCKERCSQLWAPPQNLVPGCGPQRRTWFPAVGHCEEPCSRLRATIQNQVLGCGPHPISRLWTLSQNLVTGCGPLRRIWFRVVSRSAEPDS
jgi:hypothetical protein